MGWKARTFSRSPVPMSGISEQFHFVNKSARSASLSHSDAAEEKFYIQSYVQSKHRKWPGQPKQPTKHFRTKSSTSQDTIHPPWQVEGAHGLVVQVAPPPPSSYQRSRWLHEEVLSTSQ